MQRIDGARRIKVAIRLLRLADDLDQVVAVIFELGVGMDAQRVSCAFEHFIYVGVVERIRRILMIFEWLSA